MLNAHTIAVTATGRTDRVINTQDVFRGAIPPAGLLFLTLSLAAGWLFANRSSAGRRPPRARTTHLERDSHTEVAAVVFLALLLGGCRQRALLCRGGCRDGRTSCCLRGVLSQRICTRTIGPHADGDDGDDGYSLRAASCGHHVHARAAPARHRQAHRGLDRGHARRPDRRGRDRSSVPFGLSAFVLDAFEIIFVSVPILIPPLLIRVARRASGSPCCSC